MGKVGAFEHPSPRLYGKTGGRVGPPPHTHSLRWGAHMFGSQPKPPGSMGLQRSKFGAEYYPACRCKPSKEIVDYQITATVTLGMAHSPQPAQYFHKRRFQPNQIEMCNILYAINQRFNRCRLQHLRHTVWQQPYNHRSCCEQELLLCELLVPLEVPRKSRHLLLWPDCP